MPNNRYPSARGFTLIEVLVTIGIIVILVGLLIPGIARVRRAAYGASTQAQLVTLANAIQQYYGDFRAYPGPLPNNQIALTALAGNTPAPPTAPYVLDPNNAQPDYLQYVAVGSTTPVAFPQPTTITGSENLVLGLLGGLELGLNGANYTFNYNANNIFDSSSSPTAKGASSLNAARPKRYQGYLQVARGDLSEPNPTINNGQYSDDAGRHAQDSIIPEFVDKFSTPMPILYMRANVGGAAVAGIGGKDDAGTQLVDANGVNVTPQWDLQDVMGYTIAPASSSTGAIGTKVGSSSSDHHGLQGLGTGGSGTVAMTDTIASGWANAGKNALAYLKDPTAGSTAASNVGGVARQKDGFILISAGPDGIYGTADDIIYPGSLNP